MINLHNIFGVAGKPILHSKSPDVFNYFHGETHLNDSYYIRIISDSAKEISEIMNTLNIKGLNITSPFKEDIIYYLDEVNAPANIINAVNVIVNYDDKLIGYNTDYIGVIETIKKHDLNKSNLKYLVIGAGGAGRAAAYGLMREGLNVTIINRTNDKAKEYSEKIKCRFADWNSIGDEIKKANVIINTLSSKYFNLDKYDTKGKYVLKADYTKSNDKNVSGLEWLIHQAMPSLKFFTGLDITVDKTDFNAIIEKLNEKSSGVPKKANISLIGFIGSGKTAIGRILAEKLNWEFIDTDELIVQKENIPIREIFRKFGETYFRNLEREILDSLKDRKNIVISCGGGLILEDDNSELLKEISNIFWIFSPIEKCIERLDNELRPPLTNPFDSVTDPLEKAEILFNYRIPYYCEIADALVYNNYSIDDAVNKIYEEVHTYFGY